MVSKTNRVATIAHVTQITLWLVALFYLYGAIVHVLNIFSLTGFDWLSAPFKWQALDVVYLILDLTVFAGLARRWTISVVAFYIAATTQILLYTIFRQWILDVRFEFTVAAEQQAYLDSLVWFHVVTLALVTLAIVSGRRGVA